MKQLTWLLLFPLMGGLNEGQSPLSASLEFSWPHGAEVAVSLTFDDGRYSQVDTGTVVLDRLGAKATFYVLPGPVAERLEAWKTAVANGHEIGNHSVRHPCSGNFVWAREKALETYSLETMEQELLAANDQLERLLGVRPVSYAYPCGQTFVGRGLETKSYVPVIAKHFSSGRGWLDEAPNDPTYCDMARLTGMEMDGKDVEYVKSLVEQARTGNHWLVLAGHDIGIGGRQTTQIEMLEQLIPYLQDPGNKVWLATVGEVQAYVDEHRQ